MHSQRLQAIESELRLLSDAEILDLAAAIQQLIREKRGAEPRTDLSEFYGRLTWDVEPLEFQRRAQSEWSS